MTFAKVRALTVVVVLFVAAGIAVVVAISRDSQSGPPIAVDCAPGLVPANVEVPA